MNQPGNNITVQPIGAYKCSECGKSLKTWRNKNGICRTCRGKLATKNKMSKRIQVVINKRDFSLFRRDCEREGISMSEKLRLIVQDLVKHRRGK